MFGLLDKTGKNMQNTRKEDINAVVEITDRSSLRSPCREVAG